MKTKTNNTFEVNISKQEIKLSNADVNEFSRESPLGIVQTNKVVQVYNERNTKYTFKVSNPTNAGSVINLVVVDMDGDIIEYFIQYIFDPNSPTPRLSSGAIDMARFTGGMTFYNMEGSVIGNFILNDGDLIDFDGEIDPCPEDEVVEEDNDATDDTNNSNSGGGGTQSSDTDNSNDGTTGGNGEIEDPDNPNPCVIGVSYGDCGCGPLGANDGHSRNPDSHCCKGSPTTFTDTCNGNSFTINNRSISGESSPCDGEVGILIDDEIITNRKNCNELNNLTNNFAVKQKLIELKADAGDATLDKEKGFRITKNSNNVTIPSNIKTATKNKISYAPAANTSGVAHIHELIGTIHMFSVMDIFALTTINNNFNIPNFETDESLPVYILVSGSGTYAIKINDLVSLNDYANEFPTERKRKREHKRLNSKYNLYFNPSTGQTANSSVYEEIFVRYIQSKGVSLFKADNSLSNWTRLEYDTNYNNNIKPTDCNEN